MHEPRRYCLHCGLLACWQPRGSRDFASCLFLLWFPLRTAEAKAGQSSRELARDNVSGRFSHPCSAEPREERNTGGPSAPRNPRTEDARQDILFRSILTAAGRRSAPIPPPRTSRSGTLKSLVAGAAIESPIAGAKSNRFPTIMTMADDRSTEGVLFHVSLTFWGQRMGLRRGRSGQRYHRAVGAVVF